jgi:molybdate transport system substrate-binding protein
MAASIRRRKPLMASPLIQRTTAALADPAKSANIHRGFAATPEQSRLCALPSEGGIMIQSSHSAAIALLGLALVLSPATGLWAGELKVLAGGTMTETLGELAPSFERASGHKLVIQFDSTPRLIKQATSGAPFDLGVVPVDVLKDAAARARFASGPTIDIARVGYGVAVRAGAAKPDISTPDALKQTLLQAKSIAMLPESAAGAYVLKVFDRLGIGEAMKAKTRPQATPAEIAAAVARGDAELGVFLVNVLMARGVDLVGPFPDPLQQELVFTAAVATNTEQAEAAKAFIAYLTTPAAAALIKAKGMTPG